MKDRPWLWILIAWIALLAGTAITITICVRNAPKEVPLESVR